MRGWLFDLYPDESGMVLWLLAEPDGLPVRLVVPYRPAFYIDGPEASLLGARRALADRGLLAGAETVERVDILAGRTRRLLRVTVADPLRYRTAALRVADLDPRLLLFTCDLPVAQLYLYETGLFPLARCEVEADTEGIVRSIGVLDDPEDIDYPLPPLRVLTLALEGAGPSGGGPAAGPRPGGPTLRVEVGREARALALDALGADGLLREVGALVAHHDPDVLLVERGDGTLLPDLLALSHRRRIPLGPSREARPPSGPARPGARAGCGEARHRPGSRVLHGRWYLDRAGSPLLEEAGLDGLLELARLCRVPVQRAARTAIGAGLTSMQLALAVREGVLVPRRRASPGVFERADRVLAAGLGGLAHAPDPGVYERVGELDLSAMYPHVVSRFNLSPETVGCPCCPDGARAPGIGVRVCVRRRGLVARSIEPVLRKRAACTWLGRMAPSAAARDRYGRRSAALARLGAATFGALGHRDARFGRVESHEAACAVARELLLAAREEAARRGFHVLHALVDALWLTRPDAVIADYASLAGAVAVRVGFDVAVDGLYDWLLVAPPGVPCRPGVAVRYAGRFGDGRVKVRGLETRRRGTPALVARMQADLLRALAAGRDLEGLRAALPAALDVVRRALQRIGDGPAAAAGPAAARRPGPSPLVCDRALRAAIAADAPPPDPASRARTYAAAGAAAGDDHGRHERRLLEAAESLLRPLGYDAARLATEVGGVGPAAEPPVARRSPG